MDTPLLVGIILAVVVVFFAWQWWTTVNRKSAAGGRKTVTAGLVGAAAATNVGSGGIPNAGAEPASMSLAPPKEEKYPDVAGQSEAELRAKEPIQTRAPAVSEMPVTPDNLGPPTIPETLRHPEQSFHQPAPSVPSMTVSDVPSGRAGSPSGGGGPGAQLFAPEMAQNGGPVIGSSVFAFDGMEPTGFAAF